MRTLLLIFILVLSFGWAKAQDWQPLGHELVNEPSPGYASPPNFAMDEQGNLYVSYRDNSEDYRSTVRKYEDGKWSTVGVENFSRSGDEVHLTLAPDGTPYVTNGVDGALASRFNGTQWEAVGTTEDNIWATHIAVAGDGTPYIVTIDNAKNQEVTVLKLVDNTWQVVGNPGFTRASSNYMSLEIAPDGTPYVVSPIPPSGYRSVVMRLNGDTWETVGHSGLWEGVGYPSFTIADDGSLFLAFSDSLNDNKATVIKFDGSEWQPVGNEGFSAGFAAPDIAVDAEGTPYVVYKDSTIGRRMIVQKFNGTTWETVGNAGFTGYHAVRASILISPSGTPYVAYADQYYAIDEYLYKVKVMELVGDTWVNLGSGGITGALAGPVSMVVTPSGTPYIAYRYDTYITSSFEMWNKTRVISYTGNSWEKVGTADHLKGIYDTELATGNDGTLYMAYHDSAYNSRTSVLKYNGSDWETVGQPGFTSSSYSYDITVDNDGTPWLVQIELGSQELKVYKFNGSEWEWMGDLGYSWDIQNPQIVTDDQGTPYVLYHFGPQGIKLAVQKLEGTDWVVVGNPPVSEADVASALLAIDSEGRPMIGYKISDNLHIKVYADDEWTTLNTDDIDDKIVLGVFVNKDHQLYAAFKDEEEDVNISVYSYADGNWELVGEKDFAMGGNGTVLMDADAAGNLYIVYGNHGMWAYKYEMNCTNPTNGGVIAGNQSDCESFDPTLITSTTPASGHEGILEYKWQKSTTGGGSGFTDIMHNAPTYDPGEITQTTWFKRLARVSCLSSWAEAAESNVVVMRVNTQPEIVCPQDETVTTDPGVAYSRKTYRAVAEDVADTAVVYLVDGKAITFPYDFPVGITTVEVKVNNECATAPACSFKVTVSQATGIEDIDVNRPIAQIYPNPFTREMVVEIANPSRMEVSAEIYSISGQKIRTLAKAQKGLRISLTWDGTNEQGQKAPYGLYLLKINEQTKKVMYGQ